MTGSVDRQPRAEGPAVVREGEPGAAAVLVLDPAGEGRHGRIPASWEELDPAVRVTWLRLPACEAPVEMAREAFDELCADGRRVHLVAGGVACRLAELLAVRQPDSLLSVVLVDPDRADADRADADRADADRADADRAGSGLVDSGATVVEQALLEHRTIPAREELAGHGVIVRVVTDADAERAEQAGSLPLGHPAVVDVLRQVLSGRPDPEPQPAPAIAAADPERPARRRFSSRPLERLRALWQRARAVVARRRR
jgi:hypothetical protein